MTDPTQEELIGRIAKEREELVSAVSHVRRDVNSDVARLRASAMHQLPKVAAVVALGIAAVVARHLLQARHAHHQSIVRLRVGRFTLLQRT